MVTTYNEDLYTVINRYTNKKLPDFESFYNHIKNYIGIPLSIDTSSDTKYLDLQSFMNKEVILYKNGKLGIYKKYANNIFTSLKKIYDYDLARSYFKLLYYPEKLDKNIYGKYIYSRGPIYYPIPLLYHKINNNDKKKLDIKEENLIELYIKEIDTLLTLYKSLEHLKNEEKRYDKDSLYDNINIIQYTIADTLVEKNCYLVLIIHRVFENLKNIEKKIISNTIIPILREIYYSEALLANVFIKKDENLEEPFISYKELESYLKKIKSGYILFKETLEKNEISLFSKYLKENRIYRPREGNNEFANIIWSIYTSEKISRNPDISNIEKVVSILYGGLSTGPSIILALEKIKESYTIGAPIYITVSRNEKILNRYEIQKFLDISKKDTVTNEDIKYMQNYINKLVNSIPLHLKILWAYELSPEYLLTDDSFCSGTAMLASSLLVYIFKNYNIKNNNISIDVKDILTILKDQNFEKDNIYTGSVTEAPEIPPENKIFNNITFRGLYENWGTSPSIKDIKKLRLYSGLRYDERSEKFEIEDTKSFNDILENYKKLNIIST